MGARGTRQWTLVDLERQHASKVTATPSLITLNWIKHYFYVIFRPLDMPHVLSEIQLFLRHWTAEAANGSRPAVSRVI